MNISSYRDLRVWQSARRLEAECHHATRQFPRSNDNGLSDQIQHTAASITASIEEGQARERQAEFLSFLANAGESLAELEIHIANAIRLKYLPGQDGIKVLEECCYVEKYLNELQDAIKQTNDNQ